MSRDLKKDIGKYKSSPGTPASYPYNISNKEL